MYSMNNEFVEAEIPLVINPLRVQGARLLIVKKYFLTLAKFRKFVIANQNKLSISIKQQVTHHNNVTFKDADSYSIQRDCLVLFQVAKSF